MRLFIHVIRGALLGTLLGMCISIARKVNDQQQEIDYLQQEIIKQDMKHWLELRDIKREVKQIKTGTCEQNDSLQDSVAKE